MSTLTTKLRAVLFEEPEYTTLERDVGFGDQTQWETIECVPKEHLDGLHKIHSELLDVVEAASGAVNESGVVNVQNAMDDLVDALASLERALGAK